eukprot:g1425.t2
MTLFFVSLVLLVAGARGNSISLCYRPKALIPLFNPSSSTSGVFALGQPPAMERGAVPCFYWDESCTSSYGVDFPGNDISVFEVNHTGECCRACKETEGCLHWVARQLTDGYECHLKTVYGFPTYCTECFFSFTKSDACELFISNQSVIWLRV